MYALTSLWLNCFLIADGEMSYREEQMESQIFGPTCSRNLFPLLVDYFTVYSILQVAREL